MSNLATLAKEKLLSLTNNQPLTPDELLANRGLFLGVSKDGVLLFSDGEFKPRSNISTLNHLVEKAWIELNKIKCEVQTINVHVAVVADIVYMPDPLKWNPDTDGVYMQWGDQYRGSLMPYEIRLLNSGKQRPMQQEDVLDRLCSWKMNIPAGIWRFPSGLCWKLLVEQHDS